MHKYLIQTKRLGFRLLEIDDIYYLEALEIDPEVKKFFPDGPRNHERTKTMVVKFISFYETQGLPCFMLFELHSNEFVGRAGFGRLETGEVEIGYVLHKKFWGKGCASEAVTFLLQWAKQHIPVNYIIAYADVNNENSFRVMEKCGMKYYKTDIARGIQCKFYKIENR